jgi:hypothetical protein
VNTVARRGADRLYELLPAIYRLRDAEQGYPLQALLRVIAEQVTVVEEDIDQLYENWFVETAQDWVVPYIGDLIGYQPVHEAGEPGDVGTAQGRAANKILIPRREVADTIRNRRRKGTLAVLELLADQVAGWPARAVEFYRLLGWTQPVNHRRLGRGQTVDLRNGDSLDLLGGPFDRLAHGVDVRRIDSNRTQGRFNIPSVGVFAWRLKAYPVTDTPANCLEDAGPHCYTFSVLGQDTPLYGAPQPEGDPTHIAGELNVPAPIRRRAFERHMDEYYGEGKSLSIWAGDWAHLDPQQPIPARSILAADLTDWRYLPPRNHIAVDPVRGRIAFPPSQLPKKAVRVSYRYAFSADMGGGEYDRPRVEPETFTLYRVGEGQPFTRITDALHRWQSDQPKNAVIELSDSAVYVEQIAVSLARDQSLQLRAANRTRPVIRLLDWHTDLPDALTVTMAHDSRFTLDGLMITGRAVHIRGDAQDRQPTGDERGVLCAAEVTIRHCTLVPGWGLHNDCEPRRPAEPSLELANVRARLTVEHSILGSIQITEDQVMADPIPVSITDSIVDATGDAREALGAPGYPVAHAVLTMRRCTVFGIVQVHAIELAENCIFMSCVNVARRQRGCMRFCYVPPGCRTPRRYHCQPDLAAGDLAGADRRREQLRVRPQFNSIHYGTPAYCQLADACADEIRRGADDEAEMGAFHDLFQPQRAANLRARLEEFVPAGMQAGIIYAS